MSYVNKFDKYCADKNISVASVYADGAHDFAEWLDQQDAQAAMAKPAPRSHSCPMPSSEGDEYVCRHPLCGRRWAKDEDKPPCPLG